VENLKLLYQAVGNKVHIVFLCGTDLAAQETLFCSPQTYSELYGPFHKRLNTFTCVVADKPPYLWHRIIRYLLIRKVPFWPAG